MNTKRQLLHMGALLIIYAAIALAISSLTMPHRARGDEYLGRIGRNPFCSDCTANPFSLYNNPYYPNSPRNPFGPYGNWFSPYSARNPFALDTPKIYGTAPYGDDSNGYAPSYEDNSYANSPTDGEYSFEYQ